MEQLWEGKQWDCGDVTQQSTARGCREAQKGGGGKHSMLGGTGDVQWYGEMGTMTVWGEQLGGKAGRFPEALDQKDSSSLPGSTENISR